ncbi:MAG: choice-of-anchor R domain-containing protein [Planctomycetota bacterium]
MKRNPCTPAIAAIALAGSAHADVVFSSFGPGDSARLSGFTISGPDNTFFSATGMDIDSAFPFTPSGATFTLDSIEVPAFKIQGDGGNSMEFSIHRSAANGLPGEVLETFKISDLPSLGPDLPIFTLESSTNPLLVEGERYWVSSSTTVSDGVFSWRASESSLGLEELWAISFDKKPWRIEDPAREIAAFRVNGTVIPAPGAAGLVLGSSLLLVQRRRRTLTF